MRTEIDSDAELQGWHEANAEDAARLHRVKRHRCPADMPPCPECQQRDDDEADREYGDN